MCCRFDMPTPDFPKMAKDVYTVASLTDASDEKEFWRTKTPQQRLEALENLRRIVYGDVQSTARLQRVLEIAQLPEGRREPSVPLDTYCG